MNTDSNSILVAHEVHKKYCRGNRRSMLYGLADITRELLSLDSRTSELRKEEFWALRNFSCQVAEGEGLGIIGPNGAGKSTLLKLISGIFPPDKGHIRVKGRVGSLIEVGAGLHPLLTGRENIFLKGAVLGMSQKELRRNLDNIIAFADLGDFLDTPVRFYSNGMHVRLGFSIAAFCEPQILLVDEALAVGDMRFQYRCIERMRDLRAQGAAILYVSHNLATIRELCDTGVVLVTGHCTEKQTAAEAVDAYQRMIRDGRLDDRSDSEAVRECSAFRSDTGIRSGQREFLQIEGAVVLDSDGRAATDIPVSAPFSVRVNIRALQNISNGGVALRFRAADGSGLIGWTSQHSGLDLSLRGGETAAVTFSAVNILRPGEYRIDVAATRVMIPGALDKGHCEDQIDGALAFISLPHFDYPVWQRVFHRFTCSMEPGGTSA